MNKILFVIVLGLSSLYTTAQSGYQITINLKDCKDTIAYLTYYQMDKNFIKDTCTTIKNGKIIFKGKGKLDKGIYSLVSQQKSVYFDFFIDDETQNLELKNDIGVTNIDGLTAVNSITENDFFHYIKFITNKNKEFIDYKNSIKLESKKDTLNLTAKQKELDEKVNEYETNFLKKYKDTYIGSVLNLKMEKTLKDIPKASNGRPDSLAVYKYYKAHYWDNVDFQDISTIRNPFFYSKLKKYFESAVVTHPDSVSIQVDKILGKTKEGSLMYKLMLAHLTYTYESTNIMGFDKVFVHIVDRYFKTGKAVGIYDDEEVVKKIIKRADLLRPLLVGSIAPDLSMIKATDYEVMKKMGFENAKNSDEVTKVFYANANEINKRFYHLNTVKADFILLVFWDVDCGHCQKEIPKLITLYNKLKSENKDVKVFSVYTLHEGEKYLKYIDEHKLNDWINVYDGAHYNNVIVKYDVYSTPVIYVLDKNRVIKAKRIGVEQIENVIKEMEKEYKTK
jgi:hypothetical protein